jgi:hypothetical protein
MPGHSPSKTGVKRARRGPPGIFTTTASTSTIAKPSVGVLTTSICAPMAQALGGLGVGRFVRKNTSRPPSPRRQPGVPGSPQS